ncbi:U3 small nucleolar ribonucleoprotein protein MPP10-like [Oscarella lobularis]|uniref:U3 small nucleolar ribonucleoprotein protein MPP10-like n=1 Tax=Oscarella lobularis TaxID=121494 RepID=UPI0033132CFF
MSSILDSVLKEFDDRFRDPTHYLQLSDVPKLSLVKQLYDVASEAFPSGEKHGPLDQLVVDEHMDEESIWQQISMQNEPLLEHMSQIFSRIVKKSNSRISLLEPEEDDENNDDLVESDEGDLEEDVVSEDEKLEDDDDDEDDVSVEPVKKKSRGVKSVVDDKFFKLADMEEFLRREDEREERRRDGGGASKKESFIDYFADLESDSAEEKALMYDDFFDPPSDDEDQSVKESESEEDEKDEPKTLSTTEKRNEKLKRQIAQLEEANLAEKPWQLKGETTAKQRPENSLLEEDLQFEHRTRQAPVITEETTEQLEDIIKRRILDQAWDDVERKEKPAELPYNYRKAPVLDQEKSKLSLSEIYERDYLKQTQEKKEEKENPEHVVIQTSMKRLFEKLDALSNYHFTPKPPKEEIKIVANAPSITVEEIIPATVGNATLLAPEEIQEKGATLEKRSRAKEKKKRKKLVQKLRPGLGNKYSKEAAMKELEKASRGTDRLTLLKKEKGVKGFKSSAAFFERLQDQVSGEVAKISQSQQKRKKLQREKQSSSKFKL